jgi:hypothetical protein
MPTRSLVFALVFVVSVVACRGSDRDESPDLGSPPLELAGGKFVCAEEYAGYGDRFYPPDHPAIPQQTVRPTRCFSSAGEARRAGYTLARTPRADKLVSGIYLVPSTAALLTGCRRAARRLGFPVPCPRFLPARQADAHFCCPCGGEPKFVLTVDFTGPSTYIGMGPYGGEGHLVFAGARRLLDIRCFGARGRRPVPEIKRRRAEWLDCPNGSELHSGHVILRWRDDRAAYAVSIHSDTRPNRVLAVVLAKDVRILG